ncbi:MAG: phosphoenolpyruvate carboxylase, partial [Bacteroidia bacterium]|nr:phosphoenolpyruvate carboxylase [Bacteroidia bacterium]
INIGFWPGGDRDGNPFVLPETTLNVAERLKQNIIKNYYKDVRKLKRKLTFKGVYERIDKLDKKLNKCVLNSSLIHTLDINDVINELEIMKQDIKTNHEGLYLNDITSLLNKIKLFGLHFATLDIRQDSRIHHKVFTKIVDTTLEKGLKIFPENYHSLSESEQVQLLSEIDDSIDLSMIEDELAQNTLKTMKGIKQIQEQNGERGCNRYIISNNQTTLNVMQLFAMLKLVAFKDKLTADVVPLFETINDLANAPKVMEELYTNKAYRAHVDSRGNKQTIMLGFSDGTKDGGYLMANWAIFKAKEQLTAISKQYDIDVIFFDGRGGPPARGGGKTHQFYASLGPTIADKEVQLTIQGQTISSNFGIPESARYNLEQLISSGISNKFANDKAGIPNEDIETMDQLAKKSYETYSNFKSHQMFIPYLERMSTLKYYAKTNIGSRPSKRSNSKELVFSDLRAIPFVGSWSLLKQNVPGFFGVGSALKHYEDSGNWDNVLRLYNNSDFFRTLLANSMMSLTKSFFDLTKYMSKDPEFGEFWNIIYKEYETTKEMLLKISGYNELMEKNLTGKASIEIRESIVLPLLTIQQYALKTIQELEKKKDVDKEEIEVLEKLVTRSLFGNINASRNSA